jgi:TATA-binding protein-associated factor
MKQEPDPAQGDYFSVTAQPQDANRVVIEHKAPPVSPLVALGASSEGAKVWPFEGLVEILTLDLGDPAWETRHGAAIGLREVFRLHGRGAGRLIGLTKTENDKRNMQYLKDLTLRCICVFLLDRFGDFVSDQVVAPIRESVAQLLGAILVYMDPSTVVDVFQLLRRLVLQSDFSDCGAIWEVCHGGMLGIKYLVAVREDVFLSEPIVLDGVIECVLHGLADHDDDVRAVSAATLVPVANQFISLRPSAVQNLIDTLWLSLEELRDDLSASTGSVMDLLSKLFSIPVVLELITENAVHDEEKSFNVLIPRLFPFLRHTIRGVRLAVLRALRTFLGTKQQKGTAWISERALRLIFQNILFEQVEEIRELSLILWSDLIISLTPSQLQHMFENSLAPTTSLLFTPIGTSQNNVCLDSTLIIRPSGQILAPTFVKPEKLSAKKAKKKDIDDWTALHNKPHNLDGPMIRGDVDLVGEEIIINTRVATAKALGWLMAVWPQEVTLNPITILIYQGCGVFKDLIESGLNSPWSSPKWLACIAIEESARKTPNDNALVSIFRPTVARLVEVVGETDSMSLELVPFLRVIRRKTQALTNAFVEHGMLSSSKLPVIPVLVQGEADAGPQAFSLSFASNFVDKEFKKLSAQLSGSYKVRAAKFLRETCDSVVDSMNDFQKLKEVYERRVISSAASAVLWLGELGNKLNPIIQAIMNSLKVTISDKSFSILGGRQCCASTTVGESYYTAYIFMY